MATPTQNSDRATGWRITYELTGASRLSRDDLRAAAQAMRGEFDTANEAFEEAGRRARSLPLRVQGLLSFGVERISTG